MTVTRLRKFSEKVFALCVCARARACVCVFFWGGELEGEAQNGMR
jgi:hypothetical protein